MTGISPKQNAPFQGYRFNASGGEGGVCIYAA